MTGTALEVVDVSHRFRGLRALTGVRIEARHAEVTALIGPNGAGKTTLFNLITGALRLQHGRIVVDGTDLSRWPAHARARFGVARTFQTVRTFGGMTVADNLRLAAGSRHRAAPGRRPGSPGRGGLHDSVREIARFAGVDDVLGRPMSQLPLGVARRVELARALCLAPSLLLLDEAASGMSVEETREFGGLLAVCARDLELPVLLIEHDMELVAAVSDIVWVLDHGRLLAGGPPAEVFEHPDVIRAYLGEGFADRADTRPEDERHSSSRTGDADDG